MAYWQLRRLIESYRAAVGKPSKEIPDEVIEAYNRVEAQRRKVEELEAKGAPADMISIELTRLGDLEAAYASLLKKYGLA